VLNSFLKEFTILPIVKLAPQSFPLFLYGSRRYLKMRWYRSSHVFPRAQLELRPLFHHDFRASSLRSPCSLRRRSTVSDAAVLVCSLRCQADFLSIPPPQSGGINPSDLVHASFFTHRARSRHSSPPPRQFQPNPYPTSGELGRP